MHRYSFTDDGEFCWLVKANFKDIPYGSYFDIWAKWSMHLNRANTVSFDVHVAIDFNRSTVFRGRIVSGTMSEMNASVKAIIGLLPEVLSRRKESKKESNKERRERQENVQNVNEFISRLQSNENLSRYDADYVSASIALARVQLELAILLNIPTFEESANTLARHGAQRDSVHTTKDLTAAKLEEENRQLKAKLIHFRSGAKRTIVALRRGLLQARRELDSMGGDGSATLK